MWNLIVFAVIGLLIGAAAQVFYSERQPTQLLGTVMLGILGALAGGMLSWSYWPLVDGQFASGNLLLALLGAVFGVVFRAGVAYARRLSVGPATTP
jgi:uncharacterized membrane protein YeaQ/YmgE (transglycosylase-associated protein family)